MVSGNPPFIKADPKSDGHYKLLCINRPDAFWEAHERNKPKESGNSFYSEKFKNLLNAMFALDPAVRPSLSEIKAHPWYKDGECLDLSQIQEEFKTRKANVDAKLQRQRQAKKEQKLVTKSQFTATAGGAFTGIQPYREMELGDSIKKLLNAKVNFDAPREIRAYQEDIGYKASSQVMSVLSPNVLLKFLSLACQSVLNEFNVSEDRYMIKKGKVLKEEGTCRLDIEILKVDEYTSCIEFQRKEGAPWVFFEAVEEIKKKLPTVEIEEEKKEGTNNESKETADKEAVKAE